MAVIIEKNGNETYSPDPVSKFSALALIQVQKEKKDALIKDMQNEWNTVAAAIDAQIPPYQSIAYQAIRKAKKDQIKPQFDTKYTPIFSKMDANIQRLQYKADEFALVADTAIAKANVEKAEAVEKAKALETKLTEATAGKKTFLQQYGIFVLGGFALLLVMRK